MAEVKSVKPLLNGSVEKAVYKPQLLHEYCGNPFIEALPEIFSDDEVVDRFSYYPNITKNDIERDKNIRHHMIHRIKNFVQPLPIHCTIEKKISTMIRRGYLARNPLDKNYLEKLRILNQVKGEKEEDRQEKLNEGMSNIRTTADTISIIGISGIGKTTAIERLLLMYPQIIRHDEYEGKMINKTQIVWLKLDCPFDGAISTLCKSFFKAIDDLLGTRYLDKYGYLSRVTSTMMLHMTYLASLYGIGVIVIDEIQHLINSKNSPDEMLNFFVTLVNTIGIPTILIGTFKSLKILKQDFRQARRSGSDGNIIWDRMKKESEEWNFFLETMWGFQWLKEETPLDDKLRDVIYDQCQGITAIAVSVFMLAQERALHDDEKITPKLIKKVIKEDLHMVEPMIRALRNNDIAEISRYEDICINLDDISFKNKEELEIMGRIREAAQSEIRRLEQKKNNMVQEMFIEFASLGVFDNLSDDEIKKFIAKIVHNTDTKNDYSSTKQKALMGLMEENSKKKKKTKKVITTEGLLRIYDIAGKEKKHVYDVLKEEGFIKNPRNEFLKAE